MLFQMRPHSRKTIDAEVKVSDHVGFKLDTDKLYFGTITPGGSADRKVNISVPRDSYVVITMGGELKDWLRPKYNGFSLEADTQKAIKFTVHDPEKAEEGNYTGTVTFTFYRPFMKYLA